MSLSLPPTLLPDYSPEKLALKRNKLVQYDTTNIEGELIPAYDIVKHFRPGTVVVIEAELHVYNITAKKKDTQLASGFNRVSNTQSLTRRTVQWNPQTSSIPLQQKESESSQSPCNLSNPPLNRRHPHPPHMCPRPRNQISSRCFRLKETLRQ